MKNKTFRYAGLDCWLIIYAVAKAIKWHETFLFGWISVTL